MTTHISLQHLTERIPAAPWMLTGSALLLFGRLPSSSVKALRLGTRGVFAIRGIGNLATAAIIRYDETPVGAYHEFFICPGILWHYVPTLHVSHMLVDNDRALLAGRALWGLPKEFANFSLDWRSTGLSSVITGEDQQPLLHAQASVLGRFPSFPLPSLPFITVRGPRYQLFLINGMLRKAHRVKIDLAIEPHSPFYPLLPLLQNPHIAVWVESFQIKIAPAFDIM